MHIQQLSLSSLLSPTMEDQPIDENTTDLSNYPSSTYTLFNEDGTVGDWSFMNDLHVYDDVLSSFSPPAVLMITGSDHDPNRDHDHGSMNGGNNHAHTDSLPPGYRFSPSDAELIVHYLRKKVMNEELPALNRIHEVNIYKYNPETLTEEYKRDGENECYFFTTRDRKYQKGKRPDRKAGDGHWKATGGDKEVHDFNGVMVGFRKSLVFFKAQSPTSWLMHEYTLHNPPRPQTQRTSATRMRLDDCVLCKIYKKPKKSDQQHADDGSQNQSNRGIQNQTLQQNLQIGYFPQFPSTPALPFDSHQAINIASTSFNYPINNRTIQPTSVINPTVGSNVEPSRNTMSDNIDPFSEESQFRHQQFIQSLETNLPYYYMF